MCEYMTSSVVAASSAITYLGCCVCMVIDSVMVTVVVVGLDGGMLIPGKTFDFQDYIDRINVEQIWRHVLTLSKNKIY